jgi:uncharacterized RDD family membrane protein YckC
MNIFNKEKNSIYAATTRRGTAAVIDVWIVLFLRIASMQIMGVLWMNDLIIKFSQEFEAAFGTQEVKGTPEHINFIINHIIFANALFFYFVVIMVGAIYHAYLNSSKWQATIGKRIMKIIISTKSDTKISFKRGLLHYFLSVLPFVYLTYIMIYQMKNNVGITESIMGNPINLILAILFIIWLQIQTFSPRKTTAYDLICNVNYLNGKTEFKKPWSK